MNKYLHWCQWKMGLTLLIPKEAFGVHMGYWNKVLVGELVTVLRLISEMILGCSDLIKKEWLFRT
ncbi:hypothetical protein EPI10_024567 [Gossypium australe]|uniref:Uncharacterized protein n=1 Tax=Gossypium australe TaxID=47621 RepID=A0A5B6VYV8_9ROSI|nr:hypothetical protein EPI10_024567 [Gossypium australe]